MRRSGCWGSLRRSCWRRPPRRSLRLEANDAITAAWQANGGDTGPLGPKSGDVYPAGTGFAQNFATGKTFFTPATGAHLMQGAILEKYESLGGPADSDLGFPTIDEGPGRARRAATPRSARRTSPVIFWTPDNRRPGGSRADQRGVGQARRVRGCPRGARRGRDLQRCGRHPEVHRRRAVLRRPRPRRSPPFRPIWPVSSTGLTIPDDPDLGDQRRPARGRRTAGSVGRRAGEPYPIGSDGFGQDFVGGKIFYSPDTGANVVTGQVLAKYESVGGPEGDLGFPTTGEVDGGLAPASRMSTFAAEDKPVIFWTPDHGAVIVRGAMNAAWDKLGGATGELGAPVADQTENGDDITQQFSGGAISWDSATNKFSTEPPNLASQLAGLEVPGPERRKRRQPGSGVGHPATTSGCTGHGGGCWPSCRCCWCVGPGGLRARCAIAAAVATTTLGPMAPDDAELRADATMPDAGGRGWPRVGRRSDQIFCAAARRVGSGGCRSGRVSGRRGDRSPDAADAEDEVVRRLSGRRSRRRDRADLESVGTELPPRTTESRLDATPSRTSRPGRVTSETRPSRSSRRVRAGSADRDRPPRPDRAR